MLGLISLIELEKEVLHWLENQRTGNSGLGTNIALHIDSAKAGRPAKVILETNLNHYTHPYLKSWERAGKQVRVDSLYLVYSNGQLAEVDARIDSFYEFTGPPDPELGNRSMMLSEKKPFQAKIERIGNAYLIEVVMPNKDKAAYGGTLVYKDPLLTDTTNIDYFYSEFTIEK